MKDTEIENKTCEKCKFGRPHYFIFNGRFTVIADEMHCINKNVARKRFEKIFREKLPCDCYETNETLIKETKESVQKALIKISKELDNAIQVLESVIVDE